MEECSAELNELMGALAKAQAEMGVAGKDSNNPYFKSKYADLASVVSASRPFLAKNGLCVMQRLGVDSAGKRLIITILGHSSGQYVTSCMTLTPIKEDPQSVGSAITYMRRYSYASLVGVVADDEDDDGEGAMKSLRTQSYNGKHKAAITVHPTNGSDLASEDQVAMLDRELKGHDDLRSNLLEKNGYRSLNDIPRSKFEELYDKVVDFKEKREGKR